MKLTHCISRRSAGLVSAGCLLATHSWGAVLLQDFNLGGTQETVAWTADDSRFTNAASLSNQNTDLSPTFGTGTIAPVAPGYQAGAGFYSWMGNFGLTASTSIQNTASFTDINNVVFQMVAIDATEGGNTAVYLEGVTLTLFSGDTELATIAATDAVIGGSTVGDQGTYYGFVFQWDLSAYGETITSVQVDASLLAHSSTIESQIDIGSSYTQVIPEPSAVLLGAFGALGLLRRRRA